MSRQKVTVFASMGGVRRYGDQAFFDKRLSVDMQYRNRIAASSCMPPNSRKTAALKIQNRRQK